MTRPAAPALTVRYDGSPRTFSPGNDVVVGRDLRADVRIAHPLISRAHLLLRFDQGRWMAIDNGSLNGLYVNGQRVPLVDITDGMRINIGNPDGPAADLRGWPPPGFGGHAAADDARRCRSRAAERVVAQPDPVDRLPPHPAAARHDAPELTSHHRIRRRTQTADVPVGPAAAHASGRSPIRAAREHAQPVATPSRPQTAVERHRRPERHDDGSDGRARGPATATSRPACSRSCGRAGRRTCPPAVDQDRPRHRQRHRHPRRAGLAPPRHAWSRRRAAPRSVDNRSINGTFVNGQRVDSAMLHDGDVVTIGNVDLVFAGGTLARRNETDVATRTGGLDVHGVTWTIEGNKTLLDNISLTARPGTLTAVIGPSGAGKSTFARLVAGYTHPTTGTGLVRGPRRARRVRLAALPHRDGAAGRRRARSADRAAGADVRRRTPAATRHRPRPTANRSSSEVLEELEMTKHLDTRVDKLSGGQRKRASVALELLTGPSLLILDEPTSGLDPALDRQVMTMLRQLADAGRVVLVVTHSLTYLDVCDQVLLLAPGGKTAFCGPPSQIGPRLGTTNWADIFSTVASDPDAANAQLPRAARPTAAAAADADTRRTSGDPSHTSLPRQFSTIARRQMRLIVSDRGYFVFLAFLPFIMGVLSLSVPGDVGFGVPNPRSGGEAPNEPGQILVLLNVGAIFMGTALTIRDLIGERAIFLREQAVGLSTTAYISGQGVRLRGLRDRAVRRSSPPSRDRRRAAAQGAVASGAVIRPRTLELFVGDGRGDRVAAAMVGLGAVGAGQVQRADHAAAGVAIMSQLVFSGRHDPGDRARRARPDVVGHPGPLGLRRHGVDGRPATDWCPAHLTPQDSHWKHTAGAWCSTWRMLGAICVGYLSFVRFKIRLKSG